MSIHTLRTKAHHTPIRARTYTHAHASVGVHVRTHTHTDVQTHTRPTDTYTGEVIGGAITIYI